MVITMKGLRSTGPDIADKEGMLNTPGIFDLFELTDLELVKSKHNFH